MVFIKSITTAIAALLVVPIAAAPADLEINISPGFQNPLSSTICKFGAETLEATPDDWVKGFKNLTHQLTVLVEPTTQITATNAFFVVAGEGPLPVVLNQVVAIIDSADLFIDDVADSDPLKKGKDADSVFEAYSGATKAALFWANTMASKSNDFDPRGSSLYKPVGALGESAIRGVRDQFEIFSFLVTDYLPDQLAGVQREAAALNTGFDAAILRYANIRLGNL